jgi:N utilization substance protein B
MDVNPELEARAATRLFFDHFWGPTGQGEDDAAAALREGPLDRGLVDELVFGVAKEREVLDQALVELSRNWRVERMPLVDRNVLRLGLWELRRAGGQPVNVVLNEAIELAKRFGTTEGASFVNGILDRAASELRR